MENSTESAGTGGVAEAPRREIVNQAVLDLTGLTSAEDLASIQAIRNVAVIIVPASLNPALMRIPMENVASNLVVPDGANVKMLTGQIRMTGESLENLDGDPNDVLVLTGQMLLTTPVKKVGYKLIVMGQILAPRGSETAIGAALSQLTGQATYYSGVPRLFTGDESLGREFFELLDDPITLIIAGDLTIEPGVTPELLKAKVTEIVLAGDLKAPRSLIPMLQVLTTEKAGDLIALEDEAGN